MNRCFLSFTTLEAWDGWLVLAGPADGAARIGWAQLSCKCFRVHALSAFAIRNVTGLQRLDDWRVVSHWCVRVAALASQEGGQGGCNPLFRDLTGLGVPVQTSLVSAVGPFPLCLLGLQILSEALHFLLCW